MFIMWSEKLIPVILLIFFFHLMNCNANLKVNYFLYLCSFPRVSTLALSSVETISSAHFAIFLPVSVPTDNPMTVSYTHLHSSQLIH